MTMDCSAQTSALADRATLDRLFQYCLSLTRHRDDAFDLTQSAVERYLNKAPDQVSNLPAYLRQIARNLYYDQQRRKRVVDFDVLEDVDYLEPATVALESLVLDQLDVVRIWNLLKPNEREVLYLWAVLDMTAQEIGVELQQPRSTILARLRRTRLRIEKQMSQQDTSLGGVAHD